MSRENNTCAPRLRFPGFTGDWEEIKLGDLCSVNRGVRVTRSELMDDGEFPVFQNTDKPMGFYNLSNVEPNNPFVIIGGSAGLVGYCKSKFWAADDCAYFGDSERLDRYFLYCSLLHHSMEIKDSVRGGNIPRLDRASLERIKIHVPSLTEQKKIAECLSFHDELISSQGEKVDALKEKKAGLMQQLFPLNGDKIPCLRFSGFEGEWVEKKFSELYARHIVKNDLSFGVDKIISVANMYYKTDAKVGDDDYMRSYNIFRFGDIAFEGNKSANYAFGRFVENTIGDGIVSHVFDVYSPISNDHCLEYWRYAINYEPFMRPILEKSTKKTTMMTNLVSKDFLKQTILVPSLDEQKKIAECLTALDDQIAAESAKLDALKDHKKGLLQQLFPQPEK